jgi:hypothetical protein
MGGLSFDGGQSAQRHVLEHELGYASLATRVRGHRSAHAPSGNRAGGGLGLTAKKTRKRPADARTDPYASVRVARRDAAEDRPTNRPANKPTPRAFAKASRPDADELTRAIAALMTAHRQSIGVLSQSGAEPSAPPPQGPAQRAADDVSGADARPRERRAKSPNLKGKYKETQDQLTHMPEALRASDPAAHRIDPRQLLHRIEALEEAVAQLLISLRLPP